MLFNVDVIFLWLGAIIFVGATSLGLIRGAMDQTFVASLVGIMILIVGTVGPDKKDELTDKEEARMHQECLVAGHYSFILAVVAGAMWLMYTIWDGGPAMAIAVYLALIQVPYLVIRMALRRKMPRRKDSKKSKKKK